MIVITSKRDGFRRCGLAHSAVEKKYADDFFSADQLDELMAEPMLVVSYAEDDGTIARTAAPDKLTVAQLKDLLTDLEIEIPADAKKADLVALVLEHTAEPPKE